MNVTKIKQKIKSSALYVKSLSLYDRICMLYRRLGRHTFTDRSHQSDRLCIILAGYKEYLYPVVFGRIIQFAPKDMDICVCTAGMRSDEIAELCEKNGWSYLSTKRNNVALIQNIAIHLHPSAEFIYKLDEDIFITEGYFEHMLAAYQHAESGWYKPGVIAPLIPINGYGHVRVLQKLDLMSKYIEHFGKPRYDAEDDCPVVCKPQVARFFWGEANLVPSIDEMNSIFSKGTLEERPCAIKFSIGAILFKRDLWTSMNTFPVSLLHNLGSDERSLVEYCSYSSRPIMVSENVLVGHLGFRLQNRDMMNYYLKNKERFEIHENCTGLGCQM